MCQFNKYRLVFSFETIINHNAYSIKQSKTLERRFVMSAQEAYEQLMPEILGIKNNLIQFPNIPAEELVFEAVKISKLIVEDREPLLKSGIDPELLDSFDNRLAAYEHAESRYLILRDSTDVLSQKFKILQEKVFNMRKNLLHNLKFAFKENEKAMSGLERIIEGRTFHNKIFDLRPIIDMAKDHLEALEKIGFDKVLLDDAEILYNETKKAISEISATPKDVNEVKDIRNRAYTYLNEALSRIKDHGQFVFWKNEERLKLYKSQFRATKKPKKSKNSTDIIELEAMDNSN